MEKKFTRSKIIILSIAILVAILTFSIGIFGIIELNKKNKQDISQGAGKVEVKCGDYTYSCTINKNSESITYRYNDGVVLKADWLLTNKKIFVYNKYGLYLISYLINNNINIHEYGKSLNEISIILNYDIDTSDMLIPPIGTEYYPFSGVFDGNGHTITGLKYNKYIYVGNDTSTYNGTPLYGMFGYVSNATIKNLHLTGLEIEACTLGTTSSRYLAGGLIAFIEKGNKNLVESCLVEGVIKEVGGKDFNTTSTILGGLIGSIENIGTSYDVNVKIKNSAAQIEFTSQKEYARIQIGGLVGSIYGKYNSNKENYSSVLSVQNSYFYGSFNAYNDVSELYMGGICGYIDNGSLEITQCCVQITKFPTDYLQATYILINIVSNNNKGSLDYGDGKYYIDSNIDDNVIKIFNENKGGMIESEQEILKKSRNS